MFRWEVLRGAEYKVSVFDDHYSKVAGSGWISTGSWRSAEVLRRGTGYSWQLNVRQGGSEFTIPVPPAPQARFRVLAAAQEHRLNALRRSSPSSHLALGVLYAQAGLLDKAEHEFVALRAQNPNSQTVAALLAKVRASVNRRRSQ